MLWPVATVGQTDHGKRVGITRRTNWHRSRANKNAVVISREHTNMREYVAQRAVDLSWQGAGNDVPGPASKHLWVRTPRKYKLWACRSKRGHASAKSPWGSSTQRAKVRRWTHRTTDVKCLDRPYDRVMGHRMDFFVKQIMHKPPRTNTLHTQS